VSDTADCDPARLRRLRRTGRPVMHRRTLTSFVARLARAALQQIPRDLRLNMSLGDTGRISASFVTACSLRPDLHLVPGSDSQRAAGISLFSGVLQYAIK